MKNEASTDHSPLVKRVVVLFLLFSSFLASFSCTRIHVPKPKGQFRIELPEKSYRPLEDSFDCPYSFEYPEYSVIAVSSKDAGHPCWLNLVFPEYRAQLHLTYKPIDGNLRKYLEQSHNLAYEHQVKATNILAERIARDSSRVYGTIYKIKGPVASSLQFHVTDSMDHFLRGSLYFNIEPNVDSLAPVIDYFKKDLDHLVETMKWK